MMINNVSAAGKFSSDRTISEYAREIWDMVPTRDKLPAPFDSLQREQEKVETGISV